jgi:hypothetical protein
MKKHPLRAAFALFLLIVMFSGCQFVSDCASKKLESKCSELINYFNEIAFIRNREKRAAAILRGGKRRFG